MKLIQHTIDTGCNVPFKQQLCRHPLANLEVIDDRARQMEEKGIVSASSGISCCACKEIIRRAIIFRGLGAIYII